MFQPDGSVSVIELIGVQVVGTFETTGKTVLEAAAGAVPEVTA
jgi:hypothetical protein